MRVIRRFVPAAATGVPCKKVQYLTKTSYFLQVPSSMRFSNIGHHWSLWRVLVPGQGFEPNMVAYCSMITACAKAWLQSRAVTHESRVQYAPLCACTEVAYIYICSRFRVAPPAMVMVITIIHPPPPRCGMGNGWEGVGVIQPPSNSNATGRIR